MSMKRKRESDKIGTPPEEAQAISFANAAFSSTPKKLIGRRRCKLQPTATKENCNPFLSNPCMEVKSIADIVRQAQDEKELPNVAAPAEQQQFPPNPFEVTRKPPKKKKRQADKAEAACFENPALNLELPEKQFNPYEVVRKPVAVPVASTQCFVNEALSIRGQDVPASRNPFEIQRCSAASLLAANPDGVENPALEDPAPTTLKIGLPFTPTLGCRIDFKNMALSQLTPSKLLAEKLVFSPVPPPKRSLDTISEESAESTMDIGKELDRYQLELENSINEAKLRRNGNNNDTPDKLCENAQELTLQIEVEQKVTFTQRLAGITEGNEEEEEQQQSVIAVRKEVAQTKEVFNEAHKQLVLDAFEDAHVSYETQQVDCENNIIKVTLEMPRQQIAPQAFEFDNHAAITNDDDVVYASDSEEEEELDFKTPAPFVRAYRRADLPNSSSLPKLTVSKESLNSIKSTKSTDSTEHKKSSNMKNLIRKSIRKLIHPMQHHSGDKGVAHEKLEQEPTEKHGNFISNIRHSLRRKPNNKQPLVEQPLMAAEISIIDTSERTLKLKSNAPQTEYVRIEQLTNEKKHTLRNSIRRSTREMMKSVFHKNQEEYTFGNK